MTVPSSDIKDVLASLGSVPRAWIIRSLVGQGTPRSIDEIAETIGASRFDVERHVEALTKVGVLTPDRSALSGRVERFLVDQARLEEALAQFTTYLRGH
jgi:predicted transcriptional regulator